MHEKAQLVKLHFSQLIQSWSKSKLNQYSDKHKQEFHQQLHDLIHNLKNEDFDTLSDNDLSKRKSIIDFIFTSLEFLDKSVINTFPLEIVECLNVALKEWDTKGDSLIATSLNNSIHSFSFLPSKSLDDPLFVTIKNEYNIEFNKRLIQINLPKYFARDYFANVALYHELGHYIDVTYKISSTVGLVLLNSFSSYSQEQIMQITGFLPVITNTSLTDQQKVQILFSHLGEYFSDIFAAQYIENCSSLYIEYISENRDAYSPTHPSTSNRSKLVNDFLYDINNHLINVISETTEIITGGKKLKKRFRYLPLDDFKNLLPITIKEENDLSSLFIIAWKLWNEYSNEFEETNQMKFKLLDSKRYEIINNLVEKSISNFTNTQKWQKHIEQ